MTSIDKDEIDSFRGMIKVLRREGAIDLATRSQHIYRITNAAWFANEHEVDRVLAPPKGDFGDRLLLLLPPSGLDSDKTVIGMWCAWDFEMPSPECKIEILISRPNRRVFGFRVDPAHARTPKHRYWHVQFTYKFTRQDTRFPEADANCIDDSTPAFPIALDNPGSVTPKDAAVYAIISLYGRDIPPAINAGIKRLTYRVCPSLKALLP